MKDLFRLAGIIISIAVLLVSCGGSDSTSSSGATVTTFAGKAGSSGSTDGTGTAALFNSPSAITSDGTSLYISDSGNNTIRKIVIATGAVRSFPVAQTGIQVLLTESGQRLSLITPPASLRMVRTFMLRIPATIPFGRS